MSADASHGLDIRLSLGMFFILFFPSYSLLKLQAFISLIIPPPDSTAARIKPRQKRIELVVGVDHKCSNYDKSKGQQIVLNAQGTQPSDDERVFQSSVMDKQTLTSTLAVDSTSRWGNYTFVLILYFLYSLSL